MSCLGGSCGPTPRTGKVFDPESEGPSEADLDRFGGDERDDHWDGREPEEFGLPGASERAVNAKRAVVAVAGGIGALLVVLVLSGVLVLG